MKKIVLVVCTTIVALYGQAFAEPGADKELSEIEAVTQAEFDQFTQNLSVGGAHAPKIDGELVTFKEPGVKRADGRFFRNLLRGSEVGFCKLQGMEYVSSKTVWPESIRLAPVRLDESGRFSEVAEIISEITCRLP